MSLYAEIRLRDALRTIEGSESFVFQELLMSAEDA